MQYTHILLRTGEIFLKGKNRFIFENKLLSNIYKIVNVKVKKLRFRFIIDYFDEHQNLKKVFGLTSYSLAIRVEKDIEEIKRMAKELMKDENGYFKIETKRSDKQFPLKSPEINRIVGELLENEYDLKFSFKKYKSVLRIEINQDGAYLFRENIKCFGGIPAGVEGEVSLLLENKASLLAGLLFMKRGCNIHPIIVENNKNNENNINKTGCELLQSYSTKKIKPILVKNFEELNNFVNEKKISLLLTGQNYDDYKEYKINKNIMIFRPLIAYNQKRIFKEFNQFNF